MHLGQWCSMCIWMLHQGQSKGVKMKPRQRLNACFVTCMTALLEVTTVGEGSRPGQTGHHAMGLPQFHTSSKRLRRPGCQSAEPTLIGVCGTTYHLIMVESLPLKLPEMTDEAVRTCSIITPTIPFLTSLTGASIIVGNIQQTFTTILGSKAPGTRFMFPPSRSSLDGWPC